MAAQDHRCHGNVETGGPRGTSEGLPKPTTTHLLALHTYTPVLQDPAAAKRMGLTQDGGVILVGNAVYGVDAREDLLHVVLVQGDDIGVREEVVASSSCCGPVGVGAPADILRS